MHWKRHTPRAPSASHYAREFGIRELTAQCLLNRGFNGLEVMREFLHADLRELHDPFLMHNMETAVRRIRRAILKKERIHVHGDYDVDGVSATAVLMIALRTLGADAHYHIVNRNDASVGLSMQSLQRDHLPHKPTLLITADCGTSNVAAVEAAQEAGIDVIIVDHHIPGPRLPKCAALLNPMQPRCAFPFRQLAAVGVAFNLVLALDRFLQKENAGWPALPIHQMTDLVALGTISDLVPLTDENRIFVREGLELLRSARRPGVCALMRSARLLKGGGDTVNARTVGFRLAPLLNAAGRMDDANKCVELLITDSYRVADAVSRELQEANQLRQQCEREVLAQAVEIAERYVKEDASVLVLVERGWHPGVLGIVASRLVERYNRPALVAAIDAQGTAKGSVRSPDSVDMLDALGSCRDLLDAWGGHRVAAGVTFQSMHAEALRGRLLTAVSGQLPDGVALERTVDIDATIQFEELDAASVHELDSLAPFGASNPEPTFESLRVLPVQARVMNGGNIRMRVRQGNHVLDAYAYGMGRRIGELRRGIDIIYTPRVVRVGEEDCVELVIKDFTAAD